MCVVIEIGSGFDIGIINIVWYNDNNVGNSIDWYHVSCYNWNSGNGDKIIIKWKKWVKIIDNANLYKIVNITVV